MDVIVYLCPNKMGPGPEMTEDITYFPLMATLEPMLTNT